MLNLASLPIWQTALVFAVAAAAVWMAGSKLAALADALADRTGIGAAFVGALLLGGITSLPEAATTVSASLIGNAPLAVTNIFGGIALQVTVLAAADIAKPGAALTADVRRADVILQGVLLVFVLGIAAAGIMAGDTLVLGVGLWSTAILVGSVGAFFLIHNYGKRSVWRPVVPSTPTPPASSVKQHVGRGMSWLIGSMVVAGAVIVVSGYFLALAGDAIALQTGLESGFVGVVLLAVATSLPEISTTIGAARLGAYSLAISNIFGANILDAAILFLADAVYPGPPVLNEAGMISAYSAVLGIVLTAVFLIGLLVRRRPVTLGMGVDSLAVIVLYLGSLLVLYSLS